MPPTSTPTTPQSSPKKGVNHSLGRSVTANQPKLWPLSQHRNHLVPPHTGETLQKIVNRVSRLQVIKQALRRYLSYYSREARRDLLAIWEFIAQGDLDAADRIEREIEEAVILLSSHPELGHVRRDLTSKPVRFWAIYSCLILYDPTARPLEVVRILSGYRDIASLLK